MPIYGSDWDGPGAPNEQVEPTAPLEMYPVDSSHISEIGYDENAQTLFVRFINGSLYEYYNIPPDIYDNLLYATSKGSYLYQHVKAPGYDYARVE